MDRAPTDDAAAAQLRYVTDEAVGFARRRTSTGNTPTICRKCYVHPAIVESYLDQTLAEALKREIEKTLRADMKGLRPEEAAVLSLLHRRLAKTKCAKAKRKPSARPLRKTPRSAERRAAGAADRPARRRRAA